MPIVAALIALMLSAIAAGAFADENRREARQFWDQGDLQSAVIVLKNHLGEQPDDTDARLMLARIYLDRYAGAAAESELRRMQSAGVSRDQILLPLARALLLQGAYQRLLDETLMAATAAENRAELAALRGDAYRGLRQADRAAAEYEHALSLAAGQVDALIGLGRLAVSQRRIADARALADQATAANPASAAAWEFSAELDYALGNETAAEAALKKAEILARNKLVPRFLRALARLERGDIEAAASDIEEIERTTPNFPGLYLLRGLLMLRQGLVDRGIESLNEYLRYDANNPRAIHALALAELGRGNRDSGENLLRRYLDALPNSVVAAVPLSQSLIGRNDFASALALLRPIAKANPDAPRLLAVLSQAYSGLGDFEQAQRAIDRAVALMPENADYRVTSARNLLRLGQADASIAALDEAVRLDPLNRNAELLRIKVRLQQQRWDDALSLAEQLTTTRSDDPYALNALGLARLGAGDIVAARAAFQRALDADPRMPEAALNLAKLALRDGDSAAARRQLEALVEREPDQVDAILALAELDAAAGRAEAQRQRLSDAVSAHPGQLRPRLALARMLLANDQPGQSLAVLQTAPEDVKSNAELLLLLGETQIALGALPEAINAYQSLLAATPDRAASAHFLLARVYALQGNLAAMTESLVRGVALEPGNSLSQPAIDVALDVLKFDQRQRALMDRLVSVSDNDPRLIARQADLLAEQGDHAQAESLMQGLRASYPDDTGVLRKLFAVQRVAGNVAGYVDTLEHWHAVAPDDDTATLMLSQVYAEQGKTDQAIRLLDQLRERRPGNPLILNNLAWLLRDRDPRLALSYAEQAHRLAPKDAAAMDTLGMLLVHNGDLERGLALLDDARIADPTDATIAYHYADALVKAERGPEARLILLELVSKPFPEQQAAKALLNAIDG